MARHAAPASGRQRRPGSPGGAAARGVTAGPRAAPGGQGRQPGPPAAAELDDALLRAGQELELAIADVAQGGWCVARPEGLPVIFVRHALPGERVMARVTEVTTRFARADAVRVLQASPDRVAPPCPSARPGGCGGCDWQHVALPAQRALKAAVITQQLRRLAGIERAVTVEPLPGDTGAVAGEAAGRAPGLGWRTRVQFAVDASGLAGLRGHRSHRVIDIGDCLIAHPAVRELDIPGDEWRGASAVEVAVGGAGGAGNFAVTVVETQREKPANTKGSRRNGRGSSPRRTARTLVEGRPYLAETAAGRLWQVSADGFWQVHPAAAATLTQAVLGALRPRPGDSVLDLYCGAGLFAGAVAPLVGPGGAVTGVESDAAAVRNARKNLGDVPWADIRQADVAAFLAGQDAPGGDAPGARLVIADPPRAGLAREVVGYLAGQNQAERFAYVSCDPATLARDLGLLTEAGWRLDDLRAFDAFPMTHHVECVATLSR